MDLEAYEYLLHGESAARNFLLGFCRKNRQRFYSVCGNGMLRKLPDGRRRCKPCDYTFHDLSKRWIPFSRLSSVQRLKNNQAL